MFQNSGRITKVNGKVLLKPMSELFNHHSMACLWHASSSISWTVVPCAAFHCPYILINTVLKVHFYNSLKYKICPHPNLCLLIAEVFADNVRERIGGAVVFAWDCHWVKELEERCITCHFKITIVLGFGTLVRWAPALQLNTIVH